MSGGAGPEDQRAFDLLDRHIIACLQADGRASWTAIAERTGTSVTTAARRGQRLLANKTIRVSAVPTTNRPGHSNTLMVRFACRAGAQPAVAARLATDPNVRFLALVSGRHDLIAEVSADTHESLFHQLVLSYQSIDGIDSCETDLILHVHKQTLDWGWQLLTGEARTTPHTPHICDANHLDEYDHKIVDVLRDDGRLAFSAVASHVGLDETTVRRRFETLSNRGCVRVLTLVPAAAMGFTSELLLDVRVEPARLHDVARQLADFPGVRFLADTLSGNSLLCELIQPSESALHSFLIDTLARLVGVQGWEASLELLTIRRGFVETPWWRTELPTATLDTASSVTRSPVRRRRATTRS